MKLRYYSHASVQFVSNNGIRLLTDPWIYNPIIGNSLWLFPPCKIPMEEYVKQDIIFVSHSHVDHFSPRTLDHFDRSTPIILREHHKGMQDNLGEAIKSLGFQKIIELKHRETCEPLPGIIVTLFADESALYSIDSAIMVSDGEHTAINLTDCRLSDEEYRWIGDTYNVDLICAPYNTAGSFPGCFEIPEDEKKKLQAELIQRSYGKALKTAELLRAKYIVPCAADLSNFRRPELSKLKVEYPFAFKQFVDEQKKGIFVILMVSGEEFGFKEEADSYNRFFKSAEEKFKAFDEMKNRPDTVRLIKKMEAWEKSFKFEPDRFLSLFKDYCKYIKKAYLSDQNLGKQLNLTTEGINIGFRVIGDNSSDEYIINYGLSQVDISRTQKPLEDNNRLTMTVSIPDFLIGMVMSGEVGFQEFVNNRFSIKRIGSYTKAENSFWIFLLPYFSTFLELEGHISPENSSLDKLKERSVA